MPILEAVETSLEDFRPKNHRQFVVFNIATRFNDRYNLAKYLNVCEKHPKKVLLEAARLAQAHARTLGGLPADRFFALLDQWIGKEHP